MPSATTSSANSVRPSTRPKSLFTRTRRDWNRQHRRSPQAEILQIQSHDARGLVLQDAVEDPRHQEPERTDQKRHGDDGDGEFVTGFAQNAHRYAGAGDHEGKFAHWRQE